MLNNIVIFTLNDIINDNKTAFIAFNGHVSRFEIAYVEWHII